MRVQIVPNERSKGFGVESHSERLTLYLEGAEARGGLTLVGLERFVDAFLSALRDFDRVRRAERPRQPGRPGRREELVTALRLVGFTTGSAVLAIEPIREVEPDDELFPEVPNVAYSNALALIDAVERREPLHASVAQSLAAAARALGEGGRFDVETAEPTRRVTISEDALRGAQVGRETTVENVVVAGRLHMIDLEPDRVAIRSPDGVEWTCRYPGGLEGKIVGLIGEVVWARGVGRAVSPRAGALEIAEIEAAPEHFQPGLFVSEPAAIAELLAEQGVARPQGLQSLVNPDEEEPSALYFQAVLGTK